MDICPVNHEWAWDFAFAGCEKGVVSLYRSSSSIEIHRTDKQDTGISQWSSLVYCERWPSSVYWWCIHNLRSMIGGFGMSETENTVAICSNTTLGQDAPGDGQIIFQTDSKPTEESWLHLEKLRSTHQWYCSVSLLSPSQVRVRLWLMRTVWLSGKRRQKIEPDWINSTEMKRSLWELSLRSYREWAVGNRSARNRVDSLLSIGICQPFDRPHYEESV